MHRHILIEAVVPSVDGGRYPAKAFVSEPCIVEADIFRDGPGQIRAVVRWQKKGESTFRESPMEFIENDRFRGEFPIEAIGPYLFTIEAWTDRFGSWFQGFEKKVLAGRDVTLDLKEGIALVEEAKKRAAGAESGLLVEAVGRLNAEIAPADALEVLSKKALGEVLAGLDQREDAVKVEPILKLFAHRKKARFGAWYELFPRSEGSTPGQGATLREAERRLPKLASMGFDVVYLPPVHPIGITNRKGKDDAPGAAPGDPGCPWAIGNAEGGHTAVDPSLGTLEDFDHFVATSESLGIDVALDFAIQCSPDHPWVTEHPDWFEHSADGSIRYAENPPYEYKDVYRVDFDTQDRVGLYTELYRVILFWISHGVRIFRVDNPHTKPVSFWEWLIGKVQTASPDVIFLAESFTRPKMMKALAKAGFTQSYTYFTWRNEKRELEDYVRELTQTEMRHYFVPNFFTNTHDVLPQFLQKGGPPAFKLRLVLAAMLSPSYGIYSGYELCENEALPGTEEYKNSEKFEIRTRDYDAPGNLNDFIGRLNEIRRQNPALQELDNVQILKTDNDNITFFMKRSRDRSNVLLVAVNLDPRGVQDCVAEVPLDQLGRPPGDSFEVTDLLTGARYTWGEKNYVKLDPSSLPAHVLLVQRAHEK